MTKKLSKLGFIALLILFLCSFLAVSVSADTFNPLGPHADDSPSSTFVIGNVEGSVDEDQLYFYGGAGFGTMSTVFEWKYDTAITGTITQVQVRGGLDPSGPELSGTHVLSYWLHSPGSFEVMDSGSVLPAYDGITKYPNPWPYDDPLDCAQLYLNGEYIGGADEYVTWDTSGTNGINACFRWTNVNVVCNNESVVFELKMSSGDHSSRGYWMIFTGYDGGIVDIDGDGDSDLGVSNIGTTSRLNGVYDPQYDLTIMTGDSCTKTNSNVLWYQFHHWDDAYQTDPVYEFTYQQGLGGTPDITYNETVICSEKTVEQFDHVYFDAIMNSSLSPNILTVEKEGTEYINYSSDRKYFTVHFYPEETGTYTVNVSRDGTVYATNSIQVVTTTSPGADIHMERVTPVQTGEYVSLFANVSAHTSYEGYINILFDGESILQEYLGSNTSMAIDYETTKEGRYDVELRLEKGLGDNNPLVDKAVFYVLDQEELQTLTVDTEVDRGEQTTIAYTNNFVGTHNTYIVIQWIDPDDDSTVQQQITYIKGFDDEISFTPEKVGNHICKLYYEGFQLYYANFTVMAVDDRGSGGENEEEARIFDDVNTVWEDGAYLFGMDEGMFKLIIGAIVVILCMVLPLLLTSKKLGFSVTLPMLSNTNFTLLAGVIGVIIAFALGLWALWVVFLVGIGLVALFVRSMDVHFIGNRG